MTPTWDFSTLPASTSATTTPTLSRRRGQQFRSASESNVISKQARQGSDTPFPTMNSSVEENSHNKDGAVQQVQGRPASGEEQKRTVRRKKSSLDLRDIFLNGGLFPSEPPTNS